MQTTQLIDRSERLKQRFLATRQRSESLTKPLAVEDFSVQPIVDVSPPKWHLAHATWFFEQFILLPFVSSYQVFNEHYNYLFNSYYNNVGKRVLRPNRGLMTRPTVDEVFEYRTYVTEKLAELLDSQPNDEILKLVEIGVNHEEQHQELLCYDIKYILGHQPLFPAFEQDCHPTSLKQSNNFITIPEGIYTIGHSGKDFCFDNEQGQHKVFLHEFEIASQLVSNGEYMEFIADGGYKNFNLWHSDGWDYIQANNIQAPLYWHLVEDQWHCYDLKGLHPVDPDKPVMNISFYEAFAFAEWKGMRLPTEFEWEVASEHFEWGQLWEWTASAYLPYPNFKKQAGALGEYNGKFMVNQHVLRGASSATPPAHSRKTYRNFFHPQLRWMFSGIRLAK